MIDTKQRTVPAEITSRMAVTIVPSVDGRAAATLIFHEGSTCCVRAPLLPAEVRAVLSMIADHFDPPVKVGT